MSVLTSIPTVIPSNSPSETPSTTPSNIPSIPPTYLPSITPTNTPSTSPSFQHNEYYSGGFVFITITVDLNQPTALAYCQTFTDGTLATIADTTEQSFIKTFIDSVSPRKHNTAHTYFYNVFCWK